MAKTYIKLGEKAYSFSDPSIPFNITKGEVLEQPRGSKTSDRFKAALRGGHLIAATEEEFKATQLGAQSDPADDSLESVLKGMNKAQLSEYYQENFEVTDDEITSFEKLNKEEMVSYLVGLEEEE